MPKSPAARRLEPFPTICPAKGQYPLGLLIGNLGIAVLAHQPVYILHCGRAELAGPFPEMLRAPLAVCLVVRGYVLGNRTVVPWAETANMFGDPGMVVQDLYGFLIVLDLDLVATYLWGTL